MHQHKTRTLFMLFVNCFLKHLSKNFRTIGIYSRCKKICKIVLTVKDSVNKEKKTSKIKITTDIITTEITTRFLASDI